MVYIFLANGFEEIEAIAPIDILRRANIPCKSVGIGGKYIKSARGIIIEADICEEEANFDELSMIVLPGGMPGAKNLDESETVTKFINFAYNNSIFIAAICAAPFILGKRNLLGGVKATCYTGFEKDLYGAIITNEPVIFDNLFITARGAGVALLFALKLVEVLVGKEEAEKIRKSMLM